MKKIYAIVTVNKSYSNFYSPNDHQNIYSRLMQATNGNYEIAANVESWCELACIGERYEVDDNIVVTIEEREL